MPAVAKTGEFDARADFWDTWFCSAHRPTQPHKTGTCFVCNALKMTQQLYDAGCAANGTQRVTPEMMSEIFAQSIQRRNRDHPHWYDHRIAAELLNKRLAAPSVAPEQVLSEEQVRSVFGPWFRDEYIQQKTLALNALLRSHTAAGGKGA